MKKIVGIFLALLIGVLVMPIVVSPAFAGDLTVVCQDSDNDEVGQCDITPNEPLFTEGGIYPGQTLFETVTITNEDTTDTCDLVVFFNENEGQSEVDLAERLFASVNAGGSDYIGVASSGAALSGTTYRDLYDFSSVISLGSIAPGATQVYDWLATFDSSAGNEYQGITTSFDFTIDFSCVGDEEENEGQVAGTSTSGGGGGGNGTVAAPTCTDTAPSGVPVVSITDVGTNTVTLSWSPVSPTTHYGIAFTRTSDGATYGSPNVGNVTSYTITNLAGGSNYTFQVYAVNTCAPGELSAVASTGIVPGPFLGGNPIGEDGDVLGVEDNELADAEGAGAVAGISDEVCQPWKYHILWIVFLIQTIVIIASEYMLRRQRGLTKHIPALGATVAVIAILFFFRECACFDGLFALFKLVCDWYWFVSLAITAVLKLVSYAFIEEIS